MLCSTLALVYAVNDAQTGLADLKGNLVKKGAIYSKLEHLATAPN